MRIPAFLWNLALLVAAAFQAAPLNAAGQYLVPIYAVNLNGAQDSGYYSKVVVTNPQKFTVNFRIVDLFPIHAEPCPLCIPSEYTLGAGRSQVLRQPVFAGEVLRFGSFMIESDAPVVVESSFYVSPFSGLDNTLFQAVDIVEKLIPEGANAWIPDINFNSGGRVNLFFINPNPFPISASYTFERNRQELELPPRSTTIRNFPYPMCGNAPCPPPGPEFPPLGYRVDVSADGEFYAFASVIWPSGDALFRGAVIPVD